MHLHLPLPCSLLLHLLLLLRHTAALAPCDSAPPSVHVSASAFAPTSASVFRFCLRSSYPCFYSCCPFCPLARSHRPASDKILNALIKEEDDMNNKEQNNKLYNMLT
jgi:hypothetical protein